MLEKSFRFTFFLKTPRNKKNKTRSLYLRVTVDGIPDERAKEKLQKETRKVNGIDPLTMLQQFENELNTFRNDHAIIGQSSSAKKLEQLTRELESLRKLFLQPAK